MVLTLTPVKTGAAETAPLPTSPLDVDSQIGEGRPASVGENEGPIFLHQRPLGNQRVGDLHSKRSCQMVVTESGSPTRTRVVSVPGALRRPGWRECRKGLKSLRQPGVCQPVITEPPTPLPSHQSPRDEFRQVLAGRGRGHPGQMGELTGGSNAAVEKRQEHGSARRIRHEGGDCGNVTIGLDDGRIEGCLATPWIERKTGECCHTLT